MTVPVISAGVAGTVAPVESGVGPTPGPDLRLALAALWHEDLETAEAALRRAIDDAPRYADAHALLGATLLATGRPEGAMLEIEEALRLDPTAFLPQMKAGELALRLGDPGTAAERFLGALRASVPGSRESQVAVAARASAQRALGKSIEHRAALPRWIARLVGDRRISAPRGIGVIDVRE